MFHEYNSTHSNLGQEFGMRHDAINRVYNYITVVLLRISCAVVVPMSGVSLIGQRLFKRRAISIQTAGELLRPRFNTQGCNRRVEE